MLPTDDGKCQNCRFWQNYSDQIMADITPEGNIPVEIIED